MSISAPDGITVTHPDRLDLLELVDAWAPLVTVRLVTRTTAIWIDPLVWTVMHAPVDGVLRARGIRDGVARMMRIADEVVVGQPWHSEVLSGGSWVRVGVTHPVLSITVVNFPGGGGDA